MTVAALQPLRLDLGLTNVALLLLLLAVMSAAVWGWIVGLYATLLSNIAFNFFFVPPLYRLTVQQPHNALALVLFLIVAAITAALLARSRQNALEAEHRASDTQALLSLSRTTRDEPLDRVPQSICERIVQDFPVEACSLYRLADSDLKPVAKAGHGSERLSETEHNAALLATLSSRLPEPADKHSRIVRHPDRRTGLPHSEEDFLFIPLSVERIPIGALRIRTSGHPLSDDHEELLQAFADEAAAALHRADLAASARTAALLQETDRLKSALLSSVSHDLRTSLTSIKTSVANLMAPEVSWSEGARQEFLGAIDRETDRLTRLVTNLLDLSRIEAGALRLDLDWNDLDELLRNAVYRLEQKAPDRSVQLDMNEPLPLLRFDYLQ
ncbi:MAG: sensor histidine kinase, partial [Dehalococcoidia bacterium]